MGKNLLLVVILSVGILGALWGMSGYLMRPVFSKGMLTLYYVHGDGGAMEFTARSFAKMWQGGTAETRLVLVDCGLNADGVTCAQLLRDRYPWIIYCPYPCLNDQLELFEELLETI